jgi:hypothetical protein
MIGGEWKRAGEDRQSPLLVWFRLYRTPVGVISRLILFRLVAFWGHSAMRCVVALVKKEFSCESYRQSRELKQDLVQNRR